MGSMTTTTLSIRIRKELKEAMERFQDVDWRKEIENFIEMKLKELELSRILDTIDELLKDIPTSSEPAWKSVREFRDSR